MTPIAPRLIPPTDLQCVTDSDKKQATLRRNPTPDARLEPAYAKSKLDGLAFRPGSRAIFLGRTHYGCIATIVSESEGIIL